MMAALVRWLRGIIYCNECYAYTQDDQGQGKCGSCGSYNTVRVK
jgi:hypothetical protein